MTLSNKDKDDWRFLFEYLSFLQLQTFPVLLSNIFRFCLEPQKTDAPEVPGPRQCRKTTGRKCFVENRQGSPPAGIVGSSFFFLVLKRKSRFSPTGGSEQRQLDLTNFGQLLA